MNEPDGKAERTEAFGRAIEEAKSKATEKDDAKVKEALRKLIDDILGTTPV